MQCPKCGSNYIINSKGELVCPVCSKIRRSVTLKVYRQNDFVFYKVVDSLNISTNTYLLEHDIKMLMKEGVEVKIC